VLLVCIHFAQKVFSKYNHPTHVSFPQGLLLCCRRRASATSYGLASLLYDLAVHSTHALAYSIP